MPNVRQVHFKECYMPQTAQKNSLSIDQLSASIPATIFESINKTSVDDQTFIGHDRAKEALEFGLSMPAVGFNVFAMGEHGTGRQTLITQMLSHTAKTQETPSEWCYINHFDDALTPQALYLNPGEGKQLVSRLNTFIDDLIGLFPEIFDNPNYQRQKSAIERAFNKQYDEAIDLVEQHAIERGVALYEEKGEVGFAPLVDGQPISDKDFSQLDESQRAEFYQKLAELEHFLAEQLLELPLWKRNSSEQQRTLRTDTAKQTIKPLLKEMEHEFASNLGILKYLKTIKNNIVDEVLEILANESTESRDDKDARKVMVERFVPNLLVDRGNDEGAPVVYEQNPTFQNLFGQVDFGTFQGSTYTSYRLIRAGALHKANGGYLLLDAEKLLNQPMVWTRLKLALKTGQITIENPYSEFSPPSVYSLQPEKIPLKVKVVLLGDADIYYMLQEYDQEFTELFRVLADFDRYVAHDNDNLKAYGNIICQRAIKLGYPEVSNEALVEMVRFALRKAEHQSKISANIVLVNDLLDEAVYLAKKANETDLITAEHIQLALKAKQRRTGRISETWLSDIKERQVLISTQGKQVGKVNGLTVLEIGESVFGTPARMTATVYAGSNGVTDIEREVDLGKSIHSKGVMLLTGYLGHKYGKDFPVAISANIAIEQSYGHIDGDSASMAELCALISAITQLPIDQSVAITGSINQHGEVQSIGGVNEKIEGFFQLCNDRGLTGTQGVIIPRTNVMNLMLNDDVMTSVENDRFHIYAVEDIDQALAILMSTQAGEKNSTGRYPRKSIHGLALDKLKQFADILDGSDEE